jgi:hypothetical protein
VDASLLAPASVDDLADTMTQLHGAGCAAHKAMLEVVAAFDERFLWRDDGATVRRVPASGVNRSGLALSATGAGGATSDSSATWSPSVGIITAWSTRGGWSLAGHPDRRLSVFRPDGSAVRPGPEALRPEVRARLVDPLVGTGPDPPS